SVQGPLVLPDLDEIRHQFAYLLSLGSLSLALDGTTADRAVLHLEAYPELEEEDIRQALNYAVQKI
ncbi:MAG: DUF433 domain-containing protein, partial [Leptolyngbyaceae cyanobacterium RM1_1_2]|nr:DUF433 domain-containing protein [Leptolyngbyaceae cyanobacterium RM1_1_2]